MLDLLLAAVVLPLILTVALVLLAAVTLAPFVVALQMADARAFSTTRWGAVALAGSLLGLALALVVQRSALPDLLMLVPLGLTWIGPGALWLLSAEDVAVGGRAGAHE